MTNLEWALAHRAKFRIERQQGQIVLACNVGQIGASLPLEEDHVVTQAIDYLCLCLKTGTEYESSRTV